MQIQTFSIPRPLKLFFISLGILTFSIALAPSNVEAGKFNSEPHNKKVCGRGDNHVHTKFDLGCNRSHPNPILDLTFSAIRFLSIGVGIAVVISIMIAGIKYTTSEGNPEATAQAKDRIQNSLIALLFYIFIFAVVQYLVSGGVFR